MALIFDDLLVLAGLAVIVITNFRVHELFGWYSLGFMLIGLSLVFARWTRRKK